MIAVIRRLAAHLSARLSSRHIAAPHVAHAEVMARVSRAGELAAREAADRAAARQVMS